MNPFGWRSLAPEDWPLLIAGLTALLFRIALDGRPAEERVRRCGLALLAVLAVYALVAILQRHPH